MSVIGIDLGGSNIRVGIIENNQVLRVHSSPVLQQGSESEIIAQIFNLIDIVKDDYLEGIGAGVPSIVNTEEGIIYDVQNIPSWKEVHLKKYLEDRYKVEVFINNDANCFAIGEKYFGKFKHFHNIVGLIIGTGLGAGIIVDDKLYSGTNCGAGEFGMIPYKDNILEYYCSGQFFKEKCQTSGEELFITAKQGDKTAVQIFEEYGRNLGEAIKIILYSVDPEIIILGGSVSKSFEFYKSSMWKTIERFAYKKSLEKLIIECSELEQIAILGAAALFYDYHSTR